MNRETVRQRSQGSLRQPQSQREANESYEDESLHTESDASYQTRRGHWLKRHFGLLTIGSVCICFIVAYFYQPYFIWPRYGGIGESSDFAERTLLNHLLQPSNHVYRKPETLRFEWHLSSDLRRPDGVLKEVYLINGDFQGPTIECRSGDRLVIVVHNDLSEDGVGIHWHGLNMRGANNMDGAVAFTQDAIEPGSTFTYEFDIGDQYGTFFWHAHDGVQRADGMFGALVVHRPAEANQADSDIYGYDEEHLLTIGDWYHRTAKDVMAWYMRAGSFGNEPVPDSMLLNGIGSYNCSMAVPARPVDCIATPTPAISLETTKKYRLRVVNVGSFGGFSISANALSMTPIEVDGGNAIEGRPSRSVGTVYPGQRTDLVLSSIDDDDRIPMIELQLDRENFKYPNPALGDRQRFPVDMVKSTMKSNNNVERRASLHQFFDLADARATKRVSPRVAEQANLTLVLYSNSVKLAHLGNKPHGFLNQTTWQPQTSPPGHLLSLPREQWDEHQFVPQIPSSVKDDEPFWVDVVLNNLDDGSHPFHLHGYDVWSLQTHAGFGWGSWNPYLAAEPPGGPLNVINPVRRDTFIVPKRGYTVLRFKTDNPGIWMFHCHILWHQASGMAMGLQVGDHSSA